MREELRSKRGAEIRGMFARIAHRYDLLNRVLSLGRDRGWRRLLARIVAEARPGLTLDVCTGTGDVALSFDPEATTIGTDFCLPMLARARRKALDRDRALPLFAGDALHLPVADAVADVVTVAFGVRNFEDLDRGLTELVRVLRPGGKLVILEFSRPSGFFGPVMRAWVRTVPPLLGRWLSGDSEAYSYLPQSVEAFPEGERMVARLEAAGLHQVSRRPVTGGVATIYEGRRSDHG